MSARKWDRDKKTERKRRPFKLSLLSSFLCQKFAFTSLGDKIFLLIGIIFAVLAGVCLPVIVLLLADLVTIFVQYQLKKEVDNERSYFHDFWENHTRFTFIKQESFVFDSKNLGDVIELYAIETAFLGVVIFIFTCTYNYLLNYVADKQMSTLRVQYLTAVLKQPVDCSLSSEVYEKAHRNLKNFSSSVGDNFGSMILSFSVFLTSLAIAFSNHAILTAMLVALFIILTVVLFFSVVIYRYLIETEKTHYQIAENLAKDIFLNIQTVKAYEGESIEIRRFDKLLVTSQSACVNTWMFFGSVIGLLYFLLYTSYALTFWQGMSRALEMKNKNETPDILIVVNFCMQICFVNFLKIPIFIFISRQGTLAYEDMSNTMRQMEKEHSSREFENQPISEMAFISVYFYYGENEPPVLKNINVRIPLCTLTCVVGEPKSGKSTFLKLLIRLQKPKSGVVYFGKTNISEWRESSLRYCFGYVAQKTALFGDTIRDGVLGYNSTRSDTDLINVCRMVNVHSYIASLQQGYDSPLNEDLSDEIKEKLAIARVLINNPDVLILDNCMNNINLLTQMAILTEFMSQNHKTVIIVTNKLDVMKTSDLILFFNDGKIETGSYSQLLSENLKFRAIIERSDLDKTVIDFEPGVPEIKYRSLKACGRNNAGISTDEMLAHDVKLCRFLKKNRKSEQKNLGGDAEIKEKKSINCWKVLTLNRREFPYLTTAAIAATIMGFSIPAYATLFGESLGTIVLSSKTEIERNINFFPQMFLVAGLISGIAKIVEGYMIAVACSKLTKRLRKQAFEALLHKDMAFYDKEENHMSALLSILRDDARLVPLVGMYTWDETPKIQHSNDIGYFQAAGPEMVLLIKIGGIIIISMFVSIYHSWKLGLVVLGFSPFLFYGLYYLSRFQNSGVNDPKYANANEFFQTALSHAETLQTLNLVDQYMTYYEELLENQRLPCLQNMKTKSFLFGYSQSVAYFAYAVCMLYGGILLQENEITFTNFFKVLECLILSTVLLSQVLLIIPKRQPCLLSCARILNLFPTRSERSRTVAKTRFEQGNYVTIGYVKMKHVIFVHPYNSLVPRLHDINLQINERQTIIALTGVLNSGNSIPIKLLNQFYKPLSGSIMIDDYNISREFSLKALRRNVGLVDGKDRFFRRTVARNISYSVNSSRDLIETYVGMDDIVTAAKEADVHNFITTLPEGYYTIMTEEICRKMTPGQILRLSLARALLRDPRLLLIQNVGVEIDEDAQTLMESAIIKASYSRTVILSSSFLLSVSNVADFIYFFENGCIKEFGKHQKLMEKQGSYYKVFELQSEQLLRVREARMLGVENN